MADTEVLKQQIRIAFAEAEYPGDKRLRRSSYGNEPYLLEKEFQGKDDWQVLDPGFLDQAPDHFSTALCFFSDEAFRFYLPAYLVADMDDKLQAVDPVFHLTHGLTDSTKDEQINSRLYGTMTWFAGTKHRFDGFTRVQAAAIVAYLRHKQETMHPASEETKDEIEQALHNYWLGRAGEESKG